MSMRYNEASHSDLGDKDQQQDEVIIMTKTTEDEQHERNEFKTQQQFMYPNQMQGGAYETNLT